MQPRGASPVRNQLQCDVFRSLHKLHNASKVPADRTWIDQCRLKPWTHQLASVSRAELGSFSHASTCLFQKDSEQISQCSQQDLVHPARAPDCHCLRLRGIAQSLQVLATDGSAIACLTPVSVVLKACFRRRFPAALARLTSPKILYLSPTSRHVDIHIHGEFTTPCPPR